MTAEAVAEAVAEVEAATDALREATRELRTSRLMTATLGRLVAALVAIATSDDLRAVRNDRARAAVLTCLAEQGRAERLD